MRGAERYPKASRMKALQWDYELAFLSKQLASTCDDTFEFTYCWESQRFGYIGVMSHYSHDFIQFYNDSSRDPLILIKNIIRDWPKLDQNKITISIDGKS